MPITPEFPRGINSFSKKSLLLFIFCLFLINGVLYADIFPTYDFTFYRTIEDSVAIANSEKFGVDYTGYGFIGRTSNSGLYLRFGVQTPYQTIFNILDGYQSFNDYVESPFLNSSFLPGGAMDSNANGALHDSATPPEEITPPVIRPSESVEIPDDASTTTSSSSGEETKGATNDSISADGNPTTEKENGKTKPLNMANLRRDYSISFTIGPSFRRLVSDELMWYAGTGFSFVIENYSSLTNNETSLLNTFNVVLGLDMDTGFRINLTRSSTFRIGIHLTGDMFTYKAITNLSDDGSVNESSYSIEANIFTPIGEKTVFQAVGYVGLAHVIVPKNVKRYKYVNRTTIIGKGIKTLIE